MERAEAHKLCLLEPWNHAEDPALGGIGHLGLEAYHVVHSALAVVLAQLHHGKRSTSSARVYKAYRAHRSKSERESASPRHLFDRHAAFKVNWFLEWVKGHFFCA